MNPVLGKENLKREIGVRSLTLTILNGIVGTGIFVIPAIIAATLGASAIVAYLVCGAAIFLIGLCFAEVGSKTSTSGGTYAYIENAFGPYAGFLANNLFWFGSSMISDAATANALADTLKHFFPALGNNVFRALFFVLLFGGLALLNIRSVKNGVRFIEFATFAKLIPLVVFVIAGATFVSAENLKWTSNPSLTNVGAASLLLIFAFLGIEGPVTNGGEIKNAKRTLPLAIFLGISCVLILYISIQLVTQGVLGSTLAQQESPVAAAAGIIFGKAGITLMIIAIAISMLGSLGGEILSIPRVLYAGARNGIMPKFFASVHPRFFTPHISVAVYAGLGLLFAITGGFAELAIISSSATLIIYLGVILATIKLRKAGPQVTEKTFQIPGGIIVPLLAIGVIVWLLSNLTRPQFIGLIVFIFVCSVIYFFAIFLRKKPVVQLEPDGEPGT